MPKSPKASEVPPLAVPRRLGWCCLRCLTRRGINMRSGLLSGARCSLDGRSLGGLGARSAVAARATARTVTATGVGTTAAAGGTGAGGLLGLALGTGAGDLALVDPDLHADAAEGRAGLVEAVVDVGAEGVQRHAALAVELRARHLGAVEAARALDPDALGTGAHRGLHRLAHGAAELHAARELLGDALGDQLRVDLRALDLEDVELHLLAGELLQLAADAVGLGAAAPDDDARTRGVDVDPDAVTGALDLDLGDAGPLHALGEQLADRDVLADVGLVQLVGVPPALVVGGDAQTEAVGVDLLTHQALFPVFLAVDFLLVFLAGALGSGFTATGSTARVMWLVRLLMRVARPWARGRQRFMVGPSSTRPTVTTRSPRSRSSVVSALATALSSTLWIVVAADCGAKASRLSASSTGRPRTMLT